MSAINGSQKPILTWKTTLEGSLLPPEIWAGMFTMQRVARRHPDAIPALEVVTRSGVLVVMDAMDYRELTKDMPDVQDRRSR
ncbi:MAG: hypothetical protein QM753_08725 [Thermomicrobiales bacterium]